jgi:hypothetical protein
LFFDNLAVFTEQFPPLKFSSRPERGITMFPGQDAGLNTGPGRLPFPIRVETILPPNLTSNFTTSLTQRGKAYVFTYAGSDGILEYTYEPLAGTWSDVTARWKPAGGGGNHPSFQPCREGGVRLQCGAEAAQPEKAECVGTQMSAGEVTSRWRLSARGVSAEATFCFRLWNKSLVVDVLAPGGNVASVVFGKAAGLINPRLVTNPYYPLRGAHPAVVVSGAADAPLFCAGNADWYRSNGSVLYGANALDTSGATYNGGVQYAPKTDGTRNPCFERFFITVSPNYEELLPVVPNPVSPWKHLTGTRVWRAHGASNRTNDMRYWAEVHRYGMTQMVVTDHETGWRDGGESFTFRTRPAPGKGGDQGQYDYARFMQDKLGFVYGPYNNYTDFAPVNEYWHADMVNRTSDNQLQGAWMRCYAPKPARAVEYCEKLAPIIQQKFKFSTAYCDVHTAVAPWDRVDYDSRVPGAGTFAAVFYAYGEIMLLQKQAWNGPVYSEGNNHAFYCGLTDGNYGQDQRYRLDDNPWLVDFDLRRLHDLCCNFGMGNPGMFYGKDDFKLVSKQDRDAWLDRFLSATAAFGHAGFLVMEGGMANALRSYYLLQQLHSRYCLTNVADIFYVDEAGRLLRSSAAIGSGAYQRSQVIVRYADQTVVAANGNKSERLKTEAFGRRLDLPPNGFTGWTADGRITVISADRDGQRTDYADTPAYIYVDGRGRFMRHPKAASAGIGICRALPDNQYEVIPYQGAECGFAIPASAAVALDKDRKELGQAEVRVARGLVYVQPVVGAFSYRLSGGAAAAAALSCARDRVVPGETVSVRGARSQALQIPPDAKPGQRFWREFEGQWIDFTVTPLVELRAEVSGDALVVRLRSNLGQAQPYSIAWDAREQGVTLSPDAEQTVKFALGPAPAGISLLRSIRVSSGDFKQTNEIGLRTVSEYVTPVRLPDKWSAGMGVRGGAEAKDFGQTGGYVLPREAACGGVDRPSLFMHPPYKGATGYTFALYESVTLPAAQPLVFRAWVGKADGSDPGDGIQYKLVVLDARGTETVVAEQLVTRHAWHPIEANLGRWAGQTIKLKLISDVGPKDNSSGDWACWSGMRFESPERQTRWTLVEDAGRLRRLPAPFPQPRLGLVDWRKARAGWLRYDGKGLQSDDRYFTTASLNGVDLGRIPGAHGSEAEGKYTEKVSMKLPGTALASLATCNRLTLKNSTGDSFSVRRFWIELEMPDGTRASTEVSDVTFTQPPEWKYGEGIGVPAGEEIEVEICFPWDDKI